MWPCKQEGVLQGLQELREYCMPPKDLDSLGFKLPNSSWICNSVHHVADETAEGLVLYKLLVDLRIVL